MLAGYGRIAPFNLISTRLYSTTFWADDSGNASIAAAVRVTLDRMGAGFNPCTRGIQQHLRATPAPADKNAKRDHAPAGNMATALDADGVVRSLIGGAGRGMEGPLSAVLNVGRSVTVPGCTECSFKWLISTVLKAWAPSTAFEVVTTSEGGYSQHAHPATRSTEEYCLRIDGPCPRKPREAGGCRALVQD